VKIARVFPRRTSATPTDELAFIGDPPMLALPEIDEVHVSCAFTYDLPEADRLAEAWRALGVPVRVGGPAYGQPSGEFVPGLYLKEGCTITSRGCPNHCWFCSVPKREGGLKELEIKPGHNIMDDNLLACSEAHIRAVFAMLKGQKEPARFTGGLEAKIMKPWHVELLANARVDRFYCAYDTPDDYEPLVQAGRMLREAGLQGKAYAYVLVGYRGDTQEKAEGRLCDAARAGFLPFAMLYTDDSGMRPDGWGEFQRKWTRPAITRAVVEAAGIQMRNTPRQLAQGR
jgi:hypothetical protein